MKKVISLFLSLVMLLSVTSVGFSAMAAGTGKIVLTVKGGSVSCNAEYIVDIEDTDESGNIFFGASVTVTATVAAGYEFVGWYDKDDNLINSANPYTFAFPDETEYKISAKFEQKQCTFGINTEGNGTVTPSGKNTYDKDKVIQIEATPAADWVFDGWYENDNTLISKENPYNYKVEKTKTIKAKFVSSAVLPPSTVYSVTLYYEGSGDAVYEIVDHSVTFKATPKDGYTFDGWYIGGSLVSNAAVWTTSLAGDMTVTAKFKKPEETGSGTTGGTTETIKTTTETVVDGGTNVINNGTVNGGGQLVTVKLKVPSIVKLKGAKKAFTVTWKTDSQVDGYIIQYSKKKSFKGVKTVKVMNAATAKKKIKKLKKGTYYVRIRAVRGSYKTKWCKVKTVKVK